MTEQFNHQKINMLVVILKHGLANKVLKFAKCHGIKSGTILLGHGTVMHNKLLSFFDLTDSRKEIILMIDEAKVLDEALNQIVKKFKFHLPNHGIAFIVPIDQVIGANRLKEEKRNEGDLKKMYQSIITIVDKGYAEDVIEYATEAGARGGTVINARGSGIHESSKLFNMEISPEKEIVLILAKIEFVDHITQSISEKMNINEPGNGIIFVQDIIKTYGLFDED